MSPDLSVAPSRSTPRGAVRVLAPLALALVAGGVGCFRATGVSRPTVAVEEIPATGGDRVAGLKATAGPGDFYLGNDSVHLAVDGAAFGDREGQFGAPSGGAVLDVGSVSLDQSFHRVSVPTDMVERFGPVANQDPDLPLVFDRYMPGTGINSVNLEMQGYLLDPKGKLGVATDSQARVVGVTVTHRITLNKAENFFTLETTLANASGAVLPIRNLGDHLSQRGGGFRFNIPAVSTFAGAPINTWGVEIPGSDFATPLTSSVVAPMVGLMGGESAASTYDSHASLGILPLDADSLLVASDPQFALTENRPTFPARLVVGGPAVASLASGQSITYRRRLYVMGGPSYSPYLFPAQATAVFNEMALARAAFRDEGIGNLVYNSFGTALRGGPLQAEYKFERYTYTGAVPFDLADPTNPANQPENWRLERVEWREPTEIPTELFDRNFTGRMSCYIPVIPNAATGQAQRYRLSVRNRFQQGAPLYLGTNTNDSTRSLLPTPITPSKTLAWDMGEKLSPERADVIDPAGNVVRLKQTVHLFDARQAGTLEMGGLNPLRFTFQGLGVPDPEVQRTRKLSSGFSEVLKGKAILLGNYGAYQYTAGNQLFGTSFGPSTAQAAMYFAPGDYLAYATRGPMSNLDSLPVKAFDGQLDYSHSFVVAPPALPAGWTTFDLPSPTQATTGGFNPGELLSSA
ncbi:MAG TPA: hypothetical protein VJ463_03000, partial [Geothrix sp.]|nr:hypothetical protein [Geothrix sp.]